MLTLAELIAPHLTQGLLADKVLVIKVLAENPWFSRFYAGYFKLCRRNPSLLKVLGDDIVFFTDSNLVIAQAKLEKQEARQIEVASRKAEKRKAKRRARAEKLKAARIKAASRKGTKIMSLVSQKKIRVKNTLKNKMLNQKAAARKPGSAKIPPSCLHVKVDGVKCASPALRSEVFCYFHQRLIRGVNTPPRSRLHPIAFLEDETSIQASLMEVINALVRNTIDYRRAQLILRALHIAVKNSPRVQFDAVAKKMVAEMPQYPAAPIHPRPVESGAEEQEQEEKYRNVYRPMPPDPVAIANAAILAALPVHTRPKSPLGPLQPIPPGVVEAFLQGLSESDLRH